MEKYQGTGARGCTPIKSQPVRECESNNDAAIAAREPQIHSVLMRLSRNTEQLDSLICDFEKRFHMALRPSNNICDNRDTPKQGEPLAALADILTNTCLALERITEKTDDIISRCELPM